MPRRGTRASRDPGADKRRTHLLQERRRARAQDPLLEVLQHAHVAKVHQRFGRYTKVRLESHLLIIFFLSWFWKVWLIFSFSFDSTTSKYTREALDRAKLSKKDNDELSLLERVLAVEGNAHLATVLAFDLFLVGIDTVRWFRMEKNQYYCTEKSVL